MMAIGTIVQVGSCSRYLEIELGFQEICRLFKSYVSGI